MHGLVSLLLVLLSLPFVIGVHEAGHACAARYFRVTTCRVSIGFDKAIVTWRAYGITWVWALWPGTLLQRLAWIACCVFITQLLINDIQRSLLS